MLLKELSENVNRIKQSSNAMLLRPAEMKKNSYRAINNSK
jgi:hypothetical protein